MRKRSVVILLTCLIVVPSVAYAQASITGVVRDTTGAVLPGVTVEATSPSLIEKVRSAVTDATGQYRIEDLRPGVYTVSFALPGFSTVKREGIELTGSFTASVNADLRVGAVEETVTVAGESPIVDIQSAAREQVISGDLISSIPSARVYASLAVLIPGVTVNSRDVDGIQGPSSPTFGIHGGPAREGRAQVDGLSVGASLGGSGVSGYIPDVANSQEVTVNTSGALGEAEVGGPVINVVPRVGGNSIKGTFYVNGASSAMQGSNYTQALRDAGLTAPAELIKLWDVNGAVGGPIRKDRLWYFLSGRHQGSDQYVTNMYENLNAGNAAAWTYEPDFSRQATNDGLWKSLSLRLTLQATSRDKFNIFWDEQSSCRPKNGGGSATITPEATPLSYCGGPYRSQQVTWTSPASSRLLLEAAYGTILLRWGSKERLPDNRGLIRVQEQAGSIPGLTYRSQDWADGWIGTQTWRAAASYVTGSKSVKVGYQGAWYVNDQARYTNDERLAYRFNNGIPNQLTMIGIPPPLPQQVSHSRAAFNAFYGQGQWTLDRLTLQGALRYDHAWSYFPAHQIGPERFIPEALVFPRLEGVKGYDDITPRMAAVYDVFGNGKTSLKINLGKYLDPVSNNTNYTGPSPELRLALTTTRSWTDANRNYVADCDLMNPAAQDLRPAGGDQCGAWANQNFGKNVFSNTYDPALLEGWGVRPYDWSFGTSVQQEVLPRVAVEVGYYRRSWSRFTVTDNRANPASAYSGFSIPAPNDPRLPGGGGYVVSGLYDVDPALFGKTDNLITDARNYGDQYQYWHGVDVNVTARPRNGLTFQGGTSTGQSVSDMCKVRAQLPGLATMSAIQSTINATNPYCHVASGFLTQVRGLASYTVPKIDVQVSGTVQSNPGALLAANYNVPNAIVAQSLGRNLAGGAANVTVNLIEPGSLYGDRVNQVNLRVAKVLRFGRATTQIGVDIYNVFNSAAVQTYNLTYSPTSTTWLTPTQVLGARFARIGAQVDF